MTWLFSMALSHDTFTFTVSQFFFYVIPQILLYSNQNAFQQFLYYEWVILKLMRVLKTCCFVPLNTFPHSNCRRHVTKCIENVSEVNFLKIFFKFQAEFWLQLISYEYLKVNFIRTTIFGIWEKLWIEKCWKNLACFGTKEKVISYVIENVIGLFSRESDCKSLLTSETSFTFHSVHWWDVSTDVSTGDARWLCLPYYKFGFSVKLICKEYKITLVLVFFSQNYSLFYSVEELYLQGITKET